jgi:glycosyltransferase involved in cell wall biosynthesis
MKRVLLLSTVHPPNDPRIVYKIAPSLGASYEVIVALPGKIPPGQPVSTPRIQLPRFRHLMFRLLLSYPVVLWKCLRLRPQIVHIFVAELIPMAFLFKWMGAKIIYEVQENLYKKLSIKRYNNGILFQYLFRTFDHLARQHFHCIFTDDAYLQEYRSLRFPGAVVHNYASLPLLDQLPTRTDYPVKTPVFIYCGVISMERAFDTLVGALAILRTSYPDFQVHLFGPVLFSQQEAEALPGYQTIKPHLTFYGYTDQRIALSYTQNAVAGLALLKPVGDYPDSYTTKLFEYMALKLPVVTSDFPLYQEVVQSSGCGFCISPYDASALAKTLIWLIRHPRERHSMGQNGREAVENKYNWESEEAILLRYYTHL